MRGRLFEANPFPSALCRRFDCPTRDCKKTGVAGREDCPGNGLKAPADGRPRTSRELMFPQAVAEICKAVDQLCAHGLEMDDKGEVTPRAREVEAAEGLRGVVPVACNRAVEA